MVGRSICRRLKHQRGIEVITSDRAELDLCNQAEVVAFMQSKKPDEVILCRQIGGIHANNTYPAEFIYRYRYRTIFIHKAHTIGVQKLLFLGSSVFIPGGSATDARRRSSDRCA